MASSRVLNWYSGPRSEMAAAVVISLRLLAGAMGSSALRANSRWPDSTSMRSIEQVLPI